MAQVPTRTDRRSQLTKQTGDAQGKPGSPVAEKPGLHFIAANARERGGEIDLIMRDGAVTVFGSALSAAQTTGMPPPASRKKTQRLLGLLACGSPAEWEL